MNNLVSNLEPKGKFKYKLNEFISMQPRAITVSKIEEILEKEHGISRSTFLRDRNIASKSDRSIPSDRLDIYAALFNTSTDDLKNYTINVKPISERKPSSLMKKIMKRTGLKKPKN